MPSLDRPTAPDPYALLPPVPGFTLTSTTIADGERVPDRTTNTPAGDNISPQLSWAGFPEQTRSFAVTCFDPDAPGPAGWWHWSVLDLPATTTMLPERAGTPQADLLQLRGDDGVAAYRGAAPPPGDVVHRYFYVVHALDVESLGVGPDTMPGAASTMLVFHTLARAVLVATYQR